MATSRGGPRRHSTTLRLSEISVAMVKAIVIGVSLGLGAMAVDEWWMSPPPIELGNVAGVRVLLGAVAGGLITVAVFGLWMRTVVVGLMAAHFSPRTLLIFLDDSFQRHLLASMSGGLVAVLVILLRMPADEQAAAPVLSTMLAVLIALASMAGVLLAIQQATRSLSLPELVSRLAEDAILVLDGLPETCVEISDIPPAETSAHTVFAPGTGWVTSIDTDRMRKALPAGGAVHLRCRVGVFVTRRHPIALVSLPGAGGEVNREAIAASVTLARTRSQDKDLAFAVSQLVDVGTFALQERWDTATAHEVLVHLGAVLEEIVDRGLPRMHDQDTEGRCIYDEVGWSVNDLVRLCVERLRWPAARDPEVASHLIRMLRRIRHVAQKCAADTVVCEVERQLKMLLTLIDVNGMLSDDQQRLRREAESEEMAE